MDWLKLFALLIAVASVEITAEGPKKKIRIHLPENVKHIHHHKKIYITNHPAPSQYAPAFMPGMKGSMSLSSKILRPSLANIIPYSQVGLFDESRPRLTEVSPAASKLLPLYRARGHYGPNQSEWNEQEYGLSTLQESSNVYPTAQSPNDLTGKRLKIVRLTDAPRKKLVRKLKNKRLMSRGKPKGPSLLDDELPVSPYHEEFYSDVGEAGTIKKIRKPPRVEKIIDGDTEHIHTYSEEHIHKIVFDQDPKVTGVVGVNPVASLSSLTAAHPLIPIKNAQTLVAIPSESLINLAVAGSMGTPSHLEYSAYNPRDVTHDHIFHDHGELPPGVSVTKDTLRLPPKVSYNSRGLPINGNLVKGYGKHRVYNKANKPGHDFSYYENIYSQSHKPKKITTPTLPTPLFESSEKNINDFRPIPQFNFKDYKRKTKPSNGLLFYGNKQINNNYQYQQASPPSPFSVSNTVVHDYEPKGYLNANPTSGGYPKLLDPLQDFKDNYSIDADYDTSASSSNINISEDKNDSSLLGKDNKKSVSTQNISFGGQDRETFVDHLSAAASDTAVSISEPEPTALDDYNNYDQTTNTVSPTPYTIKETSPMYPYYKGMALRALQVDEPGDTNVQFVEAPTVDAKESQVPTTTIQPSYFVNQPSVYGNAAEPEIEFMSERHGQKRREKKSKGPKRQRLNAAYNPAVNQYREIVNQSEMPSRPSENKNSYEHITSNVRSNLKYGDKI